MDVSRESNYKIIATDFAKRYCMGTVQIPAPIWKRIYDWYMQRIHNQIYLPICILTIALIPGMRGCALELSTTPFWLL